MHYYTKAKTIQMYRFVYSNFVEVLRWFNFSFLWKHTKESEEYCCLISYLAQPTVHFQISSS